MEEIVNLMVIGSILTDIINGLGSLLQVNTEKIVRFIIREIIITSVKKEGTHINLILVVFGKFHHIEMVLHIFHS